MNDLHLPASLREDMANPFGPVVDTAGLERTLRPDDMILAVGDVVSLTLKNLGITPKLFICDYKTQRGSESATYRDALSTWGDVEFQVMNPPAMVTAEAWQSVKDALAHDAAPVRIVVDGEEDLLGVPCLMEAPDGAVVLYGAPGRGVVLCRMTPAFRAEVGLFVERMTPEPEPED